MSQYTHVKLKGISELIYKCSTHKFTCSNESIYTYNTQK